MEKFKNDFDYVKSYSSLDRLNKALEKYDDFVAGMCCPIIIPYGKNQGRYTALFRFANGTTTHWAHRGFMIFG